MSHCHSLIMRIQSEVYNSPEVFRWAKRKKARYYLWLGRGSDAKTDHCQDQWSEWREWVRKLQTAEARTDIWTNRRTRNTTIRQYFHDCEYFSKQHQRRCRKLRRRSNEEWKYDVMNMFEAGCFSTNGEWELELSINLSNRKTDQCFRVVRLWSWSCERKFTYFTILFFETLWCLLWKAV